ncbi:MAG: hypothetical protein EBZ77_14650, partial [Chitinophagia bacterium]|nr:hypothetical protein [Chitinophagia bacterium]
TIGFIRNIDLTYLPVRLPHEEEIIWTLWDEIQDENERISGVSVEGQIISANDWPENDNNDRNVRQRR